MDTEVVFLVCLVCYWSGWFTNEVLSKWLARRVNTMQPHDAASDLSPDRSAARERFTKLVSMIQDKRELYVRAGEQTDFDFGVLYTCETFLQYAKSLTGPEGAEPQDATREPPPRPEHLRPG